MIPKKIEQNILGLELFLDYLTDGASVCVSSLTRSQRTAPLKRGCTNQPQAHACQFLLPTTVSSKTGSVSKEAGVINK